MIARALRQAGRVAVGSIEVVGKAAVGSAQVAGATAAWTGRKAEAHAQIIGGVAAGSVTGLSRKVGGVIDTLGLDQSEVDAVLTEIEFERVRCAEARSTFDASLMADGPGKQGRLLEFLTIGGFVVGDILAGSRIPDDIAEAYAKAYPVESMHMGLREKIADMHSDAQLTGLVSGVKGKLFETRYVADMNAGALPEGWHAELAGSATQPGWDIRVVDDHGHWQELLSLKATQEVAHVTEALDHYPDFDVVSTEEVYAQLASTPYGEHVIDGGISNVDLTDQVQDVAHGHASVLDAALVSVLAAAPAAYKFLWNSDRASAHKSTDFAEHVSSAKASAFAGKAAMMVIPYWPAALLASMGVSMVARVGNNRREQLDRLLALRDRLRAVADGLRLKSARLAARESQ